MLSGSGLHVVNVYVAESANVKNSNAYQSLMLVSSCLTLLTPKVLYPSLRCFCQLDVVHRLHKMYAIISQESKILKLFSPQQPSTLRIMATVARNTGAAVILEASGVSSTARHIIYTTICADLPNQKSTAKY
jgi:hypothetical protein